MWGGTGRGQSVSQQNFLKSRMDTEHEGGQASVVLTPWGIGSLPGTSRACLCLPFPGSPLDWMFPEGRLPVHLFIATCEPQYPPAPQGRSQWETVQRKSSGAESESWQVTVTIW